MHSNTAKPDTPSATVPLPALILGWLGVIPFAALPIAGVLDMELPFAGWRNGLVLYAAVILSFMGGAQWGLAMAADDGRNPSALGSRLAASVVPALWGWAVILFIGATSESLLALAAGFLLLLVYDLGSARTGLAPGWYGSLRLQLTFAVVACLGVASLQ